MRQNRNVEKILLMTGPISETLFNVFILKIETDQTY